MTELSRSLLAAAREGLAPDPAVAARVRAKVAAAVVQAGTVATTCATASAAAPASKATLPLGKLAVLLVVVGIGATAIVMHGDRPATAPHVDVASSEPDEAPPHVHLAVADDPLVLPDAPPPAAALPFDARPPRPRGLPSREPASLSREVELIDLAMVSLRKNAPLAAIETIRVFDRETFGHGQMAEDAAAIEIEARCVLRQDVTAALARFDRAWPESAQRSRIQRTCFAR